MLAATRWRLVLRVLWCQFGLETSAVALAASPQLHAPPLGNYRTITQTPVSRPVLLVFQKNPDTLTIFDEHRQTIRGAGRRWERITAMEILHKSTVPNIAPLAWAAGLQHRGEPGTPAERILVHAPPLHYVGEWGPDVGLALIEPGLRLLRELVHRSP